MPYKLPQQVSSTYTAKISPSITLKNICSLFFTPDTKNIKKNKDNSLFSIYYTEKTILCFFCTLFFEYNHYAKLVVPIDILLQQFQAENRLKSNEKPAAAGAATGTSHATKLHSRREDSSPKPSLRSSESA